MAAPVVLLGIAAGAAAMYLFDPRQGRSRRARLRDKAITGISDLEDAVSVVYRDLGNRTRGVLWRVRSRASAKQITDDVLAERVRAELGRATSHPGAIHVEVSQGRVILSGAVLESEHAQLLRAVRAVRGVDEVQDNLAVHATARGIPALQGGSSPAVRRLGLLRERWTPTTRLLAGAVGTALMLQALGRRHPVGLLTGPLGAALLLRSATNVPVRQLAGGARGRAIDVRKTIHVKAPVEQVFETLSHYESFPQFMANVREVQVREDGTSHWTVAGPAGRTVQWDAETTHREPNRLLAWRSLPGSTVEHSGTIRFEPEDDGTRLTIDMSYRPPTGALGHVVARLFGADPRTELDEDLQRMKVYLETGRPARDAAAARHH